MTHDSDYGIGDEKPTDAFAESMALRHQLLAEHHQRLADQWLEAAVSDG